MSRNAEWETDVAYVALGSNVGDRAAYLAAARAALASLPRTRLVAASDVEETAPIGPVAQGPFLNQIVALETALTPHALLDHLQRIEAEHGRVRDARWGPRTLDLDIVRYETRTVTDERLTVPHPELPHRDFWRRELAQARAAVQAASAKEVAR
ncbi:MAG TPA: 2-amino-4-hydroxy-6-hydroxymethyldihydropteridine diphosphokinase [Gemmatimonadaceae bacterium]|nr:2-amino-4-hydroxy-6-hydroxymethyldihydropteridine diphosphokinase [Gemmatimonadaceae bacterium]